MSEKFYYIDYNKIERAEDIVAIIAAINFNFNEAHPRLHLIDHLLDKDNPVVTETKSAEMPKLNLPKLKKVETEDINGGL
jgi:hypothetical protein